MQRRVVYNMTSHRGGNLDRRRRPIHMDGGSFVVKPNMVARFYKFTYGVECIVLHNQVFRGLGAEDPITPDAYSAPAVVFQVGASESVAAAWASFVKTASSKGTMSMRTFLMAGAAPFLYSSLVRSD